MEEILEAIEAQHWDYEKIPDPIEFVQNDRITLIKDPQSKTIFGNRVIYFSNEDADEGIQNVLDFYNGIPFSWWVGPRDYPEDLSERLRLKGFKLMDRYVGLAFDLRKNIDFSIESPYDFREVRTDKELRSQVAVSAKIWGYDDEAQEAVFRERKSYLELPSRRGGFIVVLDGDKGIAYSSYRYSSDGKALYLNGAGVLPEYRHQGIYKQLVWNRLVAAKEKGCLWATTQARKGMSEPILRELGFQEHGTYEHLAKIDTAR